MRNILGITIVGVAVLFVFNSAYAVNTADNPTSWQPTRNYAMLGLHPACTNYGGSINNGDSDDDGICDHWEDGTFGTGLHVDMTEAVAPGNATHYRYNLSCNTHATIAPNPSDPQNVVDSTGYTVCPSPTKKDVYVELDWMTGQDVNPTAITDVVKAYDKMGIALHIQYGENPSTSSGNIGVHYCDITYPLNLLTDYGSPGQCTSATRNSQNFPKLKQNFFGTSVERAGTDQNICPDNHLATNAGTVPNAYSYNCLTAKRMAFHYSMFANYLRDHQTYSGWGEIYGNDVIITLGNFVNGVGNIDEQEGSIMHELGHNLGIDHGGQGDTTSCKPNYVSVMNYLFQFRENGDSCRPLAYSNKTLSSLVESSLSDSNIGTYPYPSYNPLQGPDGQTLPGGGNCPQSGERKIFWTPTTVPPATTGVKNDWNNNGIDTPPQPYTQILNNFGGTCIYSTAVTLTGFNDTDFILHGNTNTAHPLNFKLTQSNFYQGNLQGDDLSVDIGEGVNHADPPFNVPLDLQAVDRTDHIGLTWTVPSSNNGLPVTGYKIYRSTSSGTEAFLVQVPASITDYDDQKVSSNITYFYKVSAISQTGESPQTDEAFVTCPSTCPATTDEQTIVLDQLRSMHDMLFAQMIIQIILLGAAGTLIPLVLRRP